MGTMQGIGLPWIGEPAFLAHEATGTVASPLLREIGEAYLDKRWGV